MPFRRGRRGRASTSGEQPDQASDTTTLENVFASITRLFNQRGRGRTATPPPPEPEPEPYYEPGRGSTAQPAGRLVAEFKKQEPPKFLGASDADAVEEWITRMSRIFAVMQCSEEQMCILAPNQLEGPAYFWWEQEVRRRKLTSFTWAQFQEMLREKYIPATVSDKMVKSFMDLKQGNSTVEEYEKELTRLARYAPWMVPDEEHLTKKFVGGLRATLKAYVVTLPYSSYSAAVGAALRSEQAELERVFYVSKGRRGADPESYRSPPRASNVDRYLKVTSPEKKKVTCFACGKRGHYASECKGKAQSSGQMAALPSGSPRKVIRCYNCGHPGHIASYCPSLAGNKGKAPETSSRPKGKVCAVTRAQAAESPAVITGMNF